MHQSVIKVTRWNLKVISLRILLQLFDMGPGVLLAKSHDKYEE